MITSSSGHEREDDDEIDLMRPVLVLWRHRLALGLITLGCGLAAFLLSWCTRPTYEATAQLVVTQSKMDGGTVNPGSVAAGYRAQLNNQSLAVQVLKEFGLDKAPYNVTVSSFLEGNLSSEVIRDTNVIVVRVRLPDAALAAKVANRCVELSVELAQRLSQDEVTVARDIIKIQLDDARERLAGAEEALGRFKKEAQIDLVQEDVDALLTERGRLMALTVEIEGERARLAKAEEEFARQDRVRTERSAVDVSAALREATRTVPQEAKGTSPREATRNEPREATRNEPREATRNEPQPAPDEFGVALRSDSLSPFINPVYEFLNQQISMSRTKLAGLERQRAELVGALKLGAPQVAQLTQLYAKQRDLARLQMEFDLAQKVYADVALRYEQARLQMASRTAQLQVLDSALPPDRPISPRPLRSAAIALAVGFILSLLGILVFDLIGNLKTESVAARV